MKYKNLQVHYEVFLIILCAEILFAPEQQHSKKIYFFFHEINAMTMLSVLLYILQNNQIFISLAVL